MYVFTGLQFGGVGGQKQQMDVVGDAQEDAAVPSRPVEDQHNLFAWSRADRMRKGR